MSRSVSAALISALVFPGVGHIYLKRAARGCIFLLPALAAALYFASRIMTRATQLVDQVNSGAVALDPVAIAAQLERQGDASSPWLAISATVMLVCWAAAIVDAFLIARAPRPSADS